MELPSYAKSDSYLILIPYGLQPLAAAALRGCAGGLILLTVLLALRVDLRVPRRDWATFLAYGVFGVALFFICSGLTQCCPE